MIYNKYFYRFFKKGGSKGDLGPLYQISSKRELIGKVELKELIGKEESIESIELIGKVEGVGVGLVGESKSIEEREGLREGLGL